MNKALATKILEKTEKEYTETQNISRDTFLLIQSTLEKDGKSLVDYFYPDDDNVIVFNSKRWSRHFIESPVRRNM